MLNGTVQVGSQSIAYWSAGSPEDGGHTLVCLHGMAGSGRCWEPLLGALGAGTYALAPDLPGHGRSEGCAPQEVAEYNQFLAGFLTALGLEHPVVLVGHCLGAAAALDFAATLPERVAGLVLSGIAPRISVGDWVLDAAARGEWLPAFWEGQVAPGAPAEVRRAAATWSVLTRPEVRYADLMACSMYDGSVRAGRVEAPTLVLAGTHDALAPADGAWALAGQLRRCTFRAMSGAGHALMVEQPSAYSHCVMEFTGNLRAMPRAAMPAF